MAVAYVTMYSAGRSRHHKEEVMLFRTFKQAAGKQAGLQRRSGRRWRIRQINVEGANWYTLVPVV